MSQQFKKKKKLHFYYLLCSILGRQVEQPSFKMVPFHNPLPLMLGLTFYLCAFLVFFGGAAITGGYPLRPLDSCRGPNNSRLGAGSRRGVVCSLPFRRRQEPPLSCHPGPRHGLGCEDEHPRSI